MVCRWRRRGKGIGGMIARKLALWPGSVLPGQSVRRVDSDIFKLGRTERIGENSKAP